MPANRPPTRLFTNALRHWADAFERGDAPEADFYFHEIEVAVNLLAMDPAFAAMLHGGGVPPHIPVEQVATCTLDWLMAVHHCGSTPP
jgi:hypothetical protein